MAEGAQTWGGALAQKCILGWQYGENIAQHECTSSSVLGGKRSQLCLCCRPTHSPSRSPIRTTSSIRCGAGTVGYRTDWPGEWHGPIILKLTIAGVRRYSLTAGSWSQHLQPHRSGSTVGGGSPRYRTVSLSQPVAVYHLTHSLTSPFRQVNVSIQYTSYNLY